MTCFFISNTQSSYVSNLYLHSLMCLWLIISLVTRYAQSNLMIGNICFEVCYGLNCHWASLSFYSILYWIQRLQIRSKVVGYDVQAHVESYTWVKSKKWDIKVTKYKLDVLQILKKRGNKIKYLCNLFDFLVWYGTV